jgi:hypothetical protein
MSIIIHRIKSGAQKNTMLLSWADENGFRVRSEDIIWDAILFGIMNDV